MFPKFGSLKRSRSKDAWKTKSPFFGGPAKRNFSATNSLFDFGGVSVTEDMGDTSPLSTPKLAFFDVQLGVLPKVQFNLWEKCHKSDISKCLHLYLGLFSPKWKDSMRKSNWKNVPRVSASIGEHTFQHSEKVFLDRIQFLYVFYAVIDSFILFVCLSIHLSVYLSFVYLSSNRKGVHYPRNEWIYSLTSIVHVCSSGLNIVYIPYRYSYTLIIGQEPWLFNMSNRAGWKSRLFQSRARIYFQRDFPAIQASPIGTNHFIIHINRWHYNRAADTFLAIIAIIHSKQHGSFSDR